ncbi:MAG TPA: LemA family protein [Spirochaetes bacterium]|nr:LemA family protein [Spirochaetota bacterium]
MVYAFVLAPVALVLLWLMLSYNGFIRKRNLLKEAWSGIDVQLKRRYDLIPNLVESVKGYASHERGLMEEITNLRTRCMQTDTPAEKAKAETDLSAGLKRLFAVAEAYPQLRASENFMDLQKNLAEIEDQIQLARRYYNGTTRDFNIMVESFPSMIVARMFNFQKAEFFEIETAGERETPVVTFS